MINDRACTVTASGITFCSGPLHSLQQTIEAILRMSSQYREDIPPRLRGIGLMQWYLYLRDSVPYRQDPDGWETISRPRITLDPNWKGPVDCDDKVTAGGAWFNLHGYKNGVEVIGKDLPSADGKTVWHIFPIFAQNVGTKERPKMVWVPFDATYPGRSEYGRLLYAPKIRKRYFAE